MILMDAFMRCLSVGALVNVGSGAGGVLFLVAWIWLMVIAFPDHIGWGVLVLLVPGLGGLIYGLVKWPATKVPLILLVVSMVLGGGLLLRGGPLGAL